MNFTTKKTQQKQSKLRNDALNMCAQFDRKSIQQILKRRKDEQARLINEGYQYIDRLGKQIQNMTVVVYGSVARGDFHLGSDVDVVIISDELPVGIKERINLLYEPIPGIVEPIGYRCDEFLQMLSKRHLTAMGVLKDGVVIRDNGFWAEIQSHRLKDRTTESDGKIVKKSNLFSDALSKRSLCKHSRQS